MKLERVDITGFKSFGEKVELTFHEGVTAIVGPNGCGKSNISDAIGWVLGEQSAKTLRGQKMEDVIFNGSEKRPALSLAEVNLRVSKVKVAPRPENGDPQSQLGEVVVTRRLHRSGDSEYLMDGVPCRLRDIHELFMGTGVGSKAYAIIEQGKIGLILSSKPTDRRVLIEEAAGVTKYKSRRRSAELKLSAAQQNLLRVNDMVYEITRQMNSLKRQAGKARRYRRLREAMDRLERVAAVKRSDELTERLEASRAALRRVTDEELRRSVSLSVAESYLATKRLEQSNEEVLLNDARDELHQLELTVERLESSIQQDGKQIEELSERRQQLQSERAELEDRLGPVREQLEGRRREQSEVEAELESLETAAARQQAALKEGTVVLAETEAEIEERRAEIVHRISKIAALHNFLQGVMANAEKVTSELLKLEEEQKEVEAERARLAETAESLGSELENARRRAEEARREQRELEERAAVLRAALAELEDERARRREELSALSARMQSLEELVAARAHFAVGAKKLFELGPEKGIRVLGSVADTIQVEPRFERAAETFLDKALQWIRVESESDAVAAQELLDNLEESGRSELLVQSLTAPPPEDMDDGFRADLRESLNELREAGIEGVCGLLSDVVRAEPRSLLALLPDAIVVETLASALAAYRLRPAAYVTLGGEVVAAPGLLRLGPGGASAGLLTSRRQIRELKETIETETARLATSERRQQEQQNELAGHESRLAALRTQQHDLEKELVGLEHRAQQLEDEEARSNRKKEVLESELSRSRSEKKALGLKRKEMEDSLLEEEESKTRAEGALEAMRGTLNDRRSEVEHLQARTAEEVSRVAALRERTDAVRLDVARLVEGTAELTTRLENNAREAGLLEERETGLEQAVARNRESLIRSTEARGERTKEYRRADAAVAELRGLIETTEGALKSRRVELEQVRESRSTAEVALAREEAELTHLREDFEDTHSIRLEDARPLLSPVELSHDDSWIREELDELKKKLDSVGPVNPMADEEYRELEGRNEFVTKQRQDLLDSISSTETAIGRIDRTSRQRFREAFDAINHEFELTFRQLFGGGRAGLSLLDEEDLLESGIDISAQPPGKKLQNVLLLSGGEKAMTAIALLFAIFRYRPSPFCLLDEVDAPLDDANVGRFLSMVIELRDITQFIVITHNRKTMEMADQMYGVTMEEPGISKMVSVNLVEGHRAEPEPVATSLSPGLSP